LEGAPLFEQNRESKTASIEATLLLAAPLSAFAASDVEPLSGDFVIHD